MKNSFRGVVLLLLILLISSRAQETFIDIFHSKVSHIVHSTIERFDTFFADPRIKEETEAYLRLRGGFRYETVPDFQKILKIDFKIRLAKIEKSIELLTEKQREKIGGKKDRKEVRKFLKHRFSIGITSSPKIYARYDIFNVPVVYKRWEITVYQRFRAERRLTENRLEETTQIYVDRLIAPETVLRIYLDRKKSANLSHQILTYSTSVRTLKKAWEKPVAVELLAKAIQSGLVNGRISLYTLQNNIRVNFYKRWAF
ncbi:MAG: hypothetical protein Q9M89_02075 [Persephonella sp.]|nr:hypothetical protein [Persephonella sp.]